MRRRRVGRVEEEGWEEGRWGGGVKRRRREEER